MPCACENPECYNNPPLARLAQAPLKTVGDMDFLFAMFNQQQVVLEELKADQKNRMLAINMIIQELHRLKQLIGNLTREQESEDE